MGFLLKRRIRFSSQKIADKKNVASENVACPISSQKIADKKNVASENVASENVACPISSLLPYDTGIYYVSRRVLQKS